MSPPAGRNWTFFFKKFWRYAPKFLEKDKTSTMLPQAKRVFIGSNARFERAPRKFCNSLIHYQE
jgi:hypothetical protein